MWPLWLAAGLALASGLILYRLRDPLLGLRALAALSLLVPLANLTLPGKGARVVVLVDLSASMGLGGKEEWLKEATEYLKKNLEAEFVGFARETFPADDLQLRPGPTDLARALSQGGNILVLLSDGNHNAATQMGPPSAPVLVVPAGGRSEPNVGIVDVLGPPSVSPGEEFPLYITLSATQATGARLRIGKKDTTLSLSPGRNLVRVFLRAGSGSTVRVELAVSAPGDRFSGDDTLSWACPIQEGGLRVVLASERPDPNLGALRRALARVSGVKVRAYLQVRPGVWLLVGDSVRRVKAPDWSWADCGVVVGRVRHPDGLPTWRVFLGGSRTSARLEDVGLGMEDMENLPPLEVAPPPPRGPAEALLRAGGLEVAYISGDSMVSAPMWAQDLASGGRLYLRLAQKFLDSVRRRRVRLSLNFPRRAPSGARVKVVARALDAAGFPPEGLSLYLNGKPMSPEGKGLYAGELGPVDTPTKVMVEAKAGGAVLARAVGMVSPTAQDPDLRDLGVDTPALREIALMSGGRVLSYRDVPKAVREMAKAGPGVPISGLPWFLVSLGLLAFEWFVRRWRGLP